MEDLNKAILEGDTALAVTLLDRFPNETLSSHRIQDKWALHCLHPDAFEDEDASRLEYTKQVIMKYVGAGWDVESNSNLELSNLAHSWNMDFNLVQCTTLLHLACIHKSLGIITLLVEEVGADVNSLTAGQVQLSPLHILLMQQEWEGAIYLVERGVADLNLVGSLEGQMSFTSVAENGEWVLFLQGFRVYSSLNPVELLLRMGYQDGAPVLNQMLARPEDNRIVWQGAREFHLALEGANPNFVDKVLEHCSGMISAEDLSWIRLRDVDGAVTQRAPSLLWLFRIIAMSQSGYNMEDREQDLVTPLSHLIPVFLNLGYDLNQDFGSTSVTLLRESDPPTQPILGFALTIDRSHETNLLLRTLLQVDSFGVNGITITPPLGFPYNPMNQVLSMPYPSCSNPNDDQPVGCWEVVIPTTDETLLGAARLLVTHGLDVSGVVIGEGDFLYHHGYQPILQMLYRAGAVFSNIFFSDPPTCFAGNLENPELFRREIQELKEWKEAFDQRNRMSLKHMSRMEVRKMLMLRSIGALKILDGPTVADAVKNAVLCISDLV